MTRITTYLLSVSFACCALMAAADEAQETFMQHLNSLCGARFEGEMTFPKDGQDSFRGELLVAEFRHCTDRKVTIPFMVGDDKSRTWIITIVEQGLELKHDHRHKDGTPDELTLYGGVTVAPGTGNTQSFFADVYTQAMIPEAASNVWSLTLSDDSATLTYHLERHQKPRFTAVLKRVERQIR